MENEQRTTPNAQRTTSSFLDWIRKILGHHEKEIIEAGEPPTEETVNSLIDKAITGKLPATHNAQNATQNAQRASCSYAIKRNIVRSIQTIREFAETHHLAETMLRALLILLAEMALGAMKGKVGTKALEALLKSLTYPTEQTSPDPEPTTPDAQREKPDPLPRLNGLFRLDNDEDNIFNIAKEA